LEEKFVVSKNQDSFDTWILDNHLEPCLLRVVVHCKVVALRNDIFGDKNLIIAIIWLQSWCFNACGTSQLDFWMDTHCSQGIACKTRTCWNNIHHCSEGIVFKIQICSNNIHHCLEGIAFKNRTCFNELSFQIVAYCGAYFV